MIINPNSITTEGDQILHTGNTHANLHAQDGSDPITPESIGAETPAGAQAKVDTHEAKAAPHSGHETPAGAQAKVDTHEAKAAPHSGHETPAGAQAKVDTHENKTSTHGATPAATPDRIIMRAANGTAKVAAPVEEDDIASRAYVDQSHIYKDIDLKNYRIKVVDASLALEEVGN